MQIETSSQLAAPALVTPRPLSEIFNDLAARPDLPRVGIVDMIEALRDRSFSPVMIVLAVPNMIPFVPGSSTVLGLLLALLSVQLVLGFDRVHLPARLSRWSFEQATFARLTGRMTPWLRRFERMARPRYWPASFRLAERLAGAVALVLSLMVMLPIPLANGLPAFAICLIALGISERDGLWLLAGIVMAALGAGLIAGIYMAGAAAALSFW